MDRLRAGFIRYFGLCILSVKHVSSRQSNAWKGYMGMERWHYIFRRHPEAEKERNKLWFAAANLLTRGTRRHLQIDIGNETFRLCNAPGDLS